MQSLAPTECPFCHSIEATFFKEGKKTLALAEQRVTELKSSKAVCVYCGEKDAKLLSREEEKIFLELNRYLEEEIDKILGFIELLAKQTVKNYKK